MVKKNKKLLILTSIVILLPILAGLVLWNRLPERIPTHWNFSGEIDGWSGKAFGVFFLPLFLLVMHWFCVGCMAIDPREENHGTKIERVALWIMPVMSVILSSLSYCAALGVPFNATRIMSLLLGLMFIAVGNYLPKCKRNYTVGIRLPWTLESDENWVKTHRFAGKVWVIFGIIALCSTLLGSISTAVTLGGLVVASVLPMIYSYRLYRAQK